MQAEAEVARLQTELQRLQREAQTQAAQLEAADKQAKAGAAVAAAAAATAAAKTTDVHVGGDQRLWQRKSRDTKQDLRPHDIERPSTVVRSSFVLPSSSILSVACDQQRRSPQSFHEHFRPPAGGVVISAEALSWLTRLVAWLVLGWAVS